jgi:phosphoglycolate phosphatase-like HAD superfamily hydrolase
MENIYLNDYGDINKIIELLKYFDIDDSLVNKELTSLVNEYVEVELDGYMSDVSTSDVDFTEDKEEYYGYRVQDGDIEECIKHGLSEIIENIDSFSGFSIDEKKISRTIDIENVSERLVEAYVDVDGIEYDHKDVVSSHNIDSIDDLFER